MLTKGKIQQLRALRDKKAREASGRFVIEGEKVVAELLAENFPFEEIYVTPSWRGRTGAADRPAPGSPSAATAFSEATSPAPAGKFPPPWSSRLTVISEADMARASHYPTPSTMLAVGKIVRRPLLAGMLDRGLTLALDHVQDAGNVGTLLRIADWFGLGRVVLSPDCADLFHQKVINASMGSFARVHVHTSELAAALSTVKVPVLGCELAGSSVHELPPLRDAVILIGNEGQGLSDPLKKYVTDRVTIPRFGGAESLNAGVAAAIVCDNLRRKTSV